MSNSDTSSENSRNPRQVFSVDRLGVLCASVASLSVLVSFVYDWGFLYTLGISFSEAPTTISDHIRSWLVWLAILTAPALFLLAQELLLIRLEKGMTETDIIEASPDPVWEQRRFDRPRKFILVTCILIFVLWLFLGDHFGDGLLFALPIIWISFARWVFRNPFVKSRYSPFFEKTAILLPATAIFVFFLGASYARIELRQSSATHQLVLQTTAEEVTLLRSFQEWLLIRHEDTTIAWVHLNKVVQIQVIEENKPYRGLACILNASWCVPGKN